MSSPVNDRANAAGGRNRLGFAADRYGDHYDNQFEDDDDDFTDEDDDAEYPPMQGHGMPHQHHQHHDGKLMMMEAQARQRAMEAQERQRAMEAQDGAQKQGDGDEAAVAAMGQALARARLRRSRSPRGGRARSTSPRGRTGRSRSPRMGRMRSRSPRTGRVRSRSRSGRLRSRSPTTGRVRSRSRGRDARGYPIVVGGGVRPAYVGGPTYVGAPTYVDGPTYVGPPTYVDGGVVPIVAGGPGRVLGTGEVNGTPVVIRSAGHAKDKAIEKLAEALVASPDGTKAAAHKAAAATPAKACKADHGVEYGPNNTYRTNLTLQFYGTPDELAQGGGKFLSEVKAEDVAIVFKERINNPDTLIQDDKHLEQREADVGHMFIASASLVAMYSTMQQRTSVRAVEAAIDDFNVVHVDGSAAKRVMLTVPPNCTVSTCRTLFDRSNLLKTSVFKKFGHVSVARLHKSISYPASGDKDQRVRIAEQSNIVGLIAVNVEPLKLAAAMPDWDGDLTADSDGNVRVPAAIVGKAIRMYGEQMAVLLPGVVDISNGISFTLDADDTPVASSAESRAARSTPGMVEVQIEITYVYPESELRLYQAEKVIAKTAKQRLLEAMAE